MPVLRNPSPTGSPAVPRTNDRGPLPAGPETTRGLFMAERARRAPHPTGLVSVVAALACSITVAAARPSTASAASVPATTSMHFRNGAVVISYMSTLLLRLVDEGKVKLDDQISKWLPNLRDSNRVTLRMLASMTAGYHDFEIDPALTDRLNNNPFTPITTQYQLKLAVDEPQQFTPGTNFSYAHSSYVTSGWLSRRSPSCRCTSPSARCSLVRRRSSRTCLRNGSRSRS
jgi:CubicO group peptidase (beta-lactamase class C family)